MTEKAFPSEEEAAILCLHTAPGATEDHPLSLCERLPDILREVFAKGAQTVPAC